MLEIRLRIALLAALALYFCSIFVLLKKKRLELRYTLLWIFGGIIMLLLLAFPGTFGALLRLIGVVEVTNGLFGIVLFLLLIILISMTSVLSQLSNKLRTLTQICAQYEKRIRDLEDEKDETIRRDAAGAP